MWRDDQKADVSKIAKRMVITNQDIIGEQFIRNDGLLTVTDEDKKIVWKSCHEKLLNTEFVWDRNSLIKTKTWSDKDMVRESVSKIKNGKAAGPTDLVSETVKTKGEAGADIIIELVIQILVPEVYPAEWDLSTILNCYKWKGDSLCNTYLTNIGYIDIANTFSMT